VKTGIQGIRVTTEVEAEALLFPGSPTVRVNGEDVEPQQTSAPSLACRLYAVALLCSEEANWITGQLIDVDGGASLMDEHLPLEIQQAVPKSAKAA
jgi:NAD(P)-dependent dehydrogenase (short-subunit alcohol dehydrogenase family)